MPQKNSSSSKNSVRQNLHPAFKSLCSPVIGVGLVAAAYATWIASTLQGQAAPYALAASWLTVALYVAWIVAMIWFRDSKARWISYAILILTMGGGILLLPRFEIKLPDGNYVRILEIGRAFELSGLFFGLAATVWISAGAWLTRHDIYAIDHIDKTTKRNALPGSIFKSAHEQIAFGIVIASFGVLLTLCSPAWEIYTKIKGIDQPKERTCSSQTTQPRQHRVSNVDC